MQAYVMFLQEKLVRYMGTWASQRVWNSLKVTWISQVKVCMLAVGLCFNIFKETLAPSLIPKNLLFLVKMCRMGPGEG